MELCREHIAHGWKSYVKINRKEFNSKGYFVAVVGKDGRCEHGIGPTQQNAFFECNKWKNHHNIIGTCELYARGEEVVWRKKGTNVSIKLSNNCEDLGKSEGGGRKVTLNFNNQTNSSIEAFWVDFEGKLKSYGTISSGEIREQGTFEKHPWLFENVDTKKCLGTYNPQFSHDKKQLNIME
jgi:hypothetical protein